MALAVGVAGLAVVAAITLAFHGSVTGTVLGDAISVEVRGVDLMAVVATILMGVFAVADVLYLNVRERSAEFASLRALGWSDGTLGRLVVYEGLGISLVGGLLGAGFGLGATALLAAGVPSSLLWTVGASTVAGVLVATTAALIPARLQRRIPMSTLLAEE
jgi:putative ABC transport system permease protein